MEKHVEMYNIVIPWEGEKQEGKQKKKMKEVDVFGLSPRSHVSSLLDQASHVTYTPNNY